MGSFPNTSFHLKNEQYRLSLLENEEDADATFHEKVKLCSEHAKKENEVPNEKFLRSDIIAPIWKPTIQPPGNRPPRQSKRPFHHAFIFLMSTVLTMLFYACILPIFSAIFVFLGIVPRLLVKLVLRFSNGRKFQLIPMTRVHGSIRGNNHTVMLVCRGHCDILKIRTHMLAMINSKDPVTGIGKFAHMQKRVTSKFGYLCMENCRTNFDIKNHVRHFDIRSKNVAVDVDAIVPYLESTYVQPFDNYLTAPQWELLVVPKYTIRKKERSLFPRSAHPKKKMYAMIFRFQNGFMNWNMLQELVIEFLGTSNGRVRSIFCPELKNAGIWKNLKTKAACLLVGPQAFMWNILKRWKAFAGMTPVQEGGIISFAATKSISAESMEDIKDRTHTGFASILGTCVRIAVRNMALGQGLEFPKSLSVKRIFNSMNNQLPLMDGFSTNFEKYRNCLERLHTSYHAVERQDVYLSGQRAFNAVMMHLFGVFPSGMSAWLYKTLTKADLVMDICPGTDEPCKIFDGDVIQDIYAWSGVTGIDTNFKVTVTSYCGRIRANVVGKLGQLAGGQSDAQIIANEFEAEYEHLASAASLYPQQLYLSPIVEDSSGIYTT